MIAAARTPPKRSTMSAPTAAAPSQVSQRMPFVNQVTRSSTNVAKPSKIAKAGLFDSADRRSSSHDWNESRCPERLFQTREFGHG